MPMAISPDGSLNIKSWQELFLEKGKQIATRCDHSMEKTDNPDIVKRFLKDTFLEFWLLEQPGTGIADDHFSWELKTEDIQELLVFGKSIIEVADQSKFSVAIGRVEETISMLGEVYEIIPDSFKRE
jgi:hypothetical protein